MLKSQAQTRHTSQLSPISLLPFPSKVLEKAIARQLTAHLGKQSLSSRFHSGFRRCHSTKTVIVKIVTDVLSSNDGGKVTALVLLDLSAAFDTVDLDILHSRLELMWVSKVPPYHGLGPTFPAVVMLLRVPMSYPPLALLPTVVFLRDRSLDPYSSAISLDHLSKLLSVTQLVTSSVHTKHKSICHLIHLSPIRLSQS